MACLVGITCSWRESESKHYLDNDYVEAISDAGAVPILIPTTEPVLAEYYYNTLDGFVFSGGGDVDPIYFGEEPQARLGEITPRRDSFELALARIAMAGNKPVLGICRGLQLINIAAGGSVYQDIGSITSQQHWQKAPSWYAVHEVEILANSGLIQNLGNKSLRVNSYHHQAVNILGDNLQAVAWSKDGLIEAVETIDTSRYLIGVQWHPECAYNKDNYSIKLFNSFVEAVQKSVSSGKQG